MRDFIIGWIVGMALCAVAIWLGHHMGVTYPWR